MVKKFIRARQRAEESCDWFFNGRQWETVGIEFVSREGFNN